jgi:hypothetical protein
MVNSIHHSEIILYKATHECAKLDKMIYHILKLYGNDSIESNVITYKGNASCVV